MSCVVGLTAGTVVTHLSAHLNEIKFDISEDGCCSDVFKCSTVNTSVFTFMSRLEIRVKSLLLGCLIMRGEAHNVMLKLTHTHTIKTGSCEKSQRFMPTTFGLTVDQVYLLLLPCQGLL